MNRFRAVVFNLVFYLNLIVILIAALPLLAAPRRGVMACLKVWGHTSLWWQRMIIGTRIEFRNRDRIPTGPLLVASKHQSLWETFALFILFDDPVIAFKRELRWIPLMGWYLRKMGMIPIDRADGARSLRNIIERAKQETARGRQLIIFPEGTRTAPGAEPDYRGGIALIYDQLAIPCLPVALNSGWFWPRRRFARHAGTLIVEILEPLPPGMAKAAFRRELEHRIETASDRIAADTANDPAGPPIPPTYHRHNAAKNR